MSVIEELNLKENILKVVNDVFDTMFSMSVETVADYPPFPEGEKRFVGSVNFAGELAGVINIHITDKFSRIMTAGMLGIETDEIEDDNEITDLIGEVINIISGNLKSTITDAGISCAISTPSITAGSNFLIESLNMETYERFAFQVAEDVFILELGAILKKGGDGKIVAGADVIDEEKLKALNAYAIVSESIADVFDTMFSIQVEPAGRNVDIEMSQKRIVGSVKIAGELGGIISIHISDLLSRIMTANMLGIETDEIEDESEIKDLVGEVINIVGGNLKSAYTDAGISCAMSTPAITSGNDFTIESLNMEKYERFGFAYKSHNIIVEVGLKPTERLVGMQIGTEEDDASSSGEEEEDQPQSLSPDQIAKMVKEEGAKAQKARSTSSSKASSSVSGDGLEDGEEAKNIDFILNLPLELTVEYGSTKKKIAELMEFTQGTVVELAELKGESVAILANQKIIARGEVTIVDEKYGIKITEIVSRMKRIKEF